MKHNYPLKIIFFGTPEFVLDSLEGLRKLHNITLSLVVSNPDRPVGRGQKLTSPPVVEYCKKNDIPFHQSANINQDQELLQKLADIKADLFLVFAFSHFLSQEILNIPRLGAYNIHTSILPKYRGSSPIHYALLNGDTSTGVSIQKMVKKMDAGDVVHTEECSIDDHDDFLTLSAKLSSLSTKAAAAFINKITTQTLVPIKQDETLVTFAPLIKKEDGLVDFLKMSAQQIYNKYRAYKLWPGVYTRFIDDTIKIIECKPSQKKLAPGEILFEDNLLHVGAQTGCLAISKIQFPNKAAVTINDFINGYKGNRPTSFGVYNENN